MDKYQLAEILKRVVRQAIRNGRTEEQRAPLLAKVDSFCSYTDAATDLIHELKNVGCVITFRKGFTLRAGERRVIARIKAKDKEAQS